MQSITFTPQSWTSSLIMKAILKATRIGGHHGVPRCPARCARDLRAPRWPVQHNGRIIPKRLHVRVEHVHPSRCKEDFLARVKANDAFKHAAKERGGA